MSSNVFADVSDSDSGHILKITLRSNTSYSGVINEVYLGTDTGIYRYLLAEYGIGLLVAMMLLFACVVSLCICTFLQFRHKTVFSMTYASLIGIIVAVQAIVESKLRQYYIHNMEIAGSISYLLVGLIPLTAGLYIDCVQKGRYRRVYKIFAALCVVNETVNLFLQIFGIEDLLSSMTRSYVLFLACIPLWLVTYILDIKGGYSREIRFPMAGVALAFIMGIVEIVTTVLHYLTITGLFLNIGMIILLTAAILESVNQISEINNQRYEAVMANKAKSGFLANMSHEIRTPINAIMGLNEMILRETDQDEIREYAFNIGNASNNLLELVNDILDFSKIESGKMELNEAEYALNDMLADVYNMIRVRADAKNLGFFINIDTSMPARYIGDELRVRQIIINLLTNAVKYTDRGKVILNVNLTSENMLRIEVKDTGIGIREEDKAKLFENFERVDMKHNRSIEGTGLGLAITSDLIRMMEGTIKVESTYGMGSSFIVEITQQIVEDCEAIGNPSYDKMKKISQAEKYKESFHAEDARVLVVDDVDINLRVFQGLLKNTYMTIDTAKSGKECIELCKANSYDIIFMDHMMPDMDGIETLKILQDENLYNCPVIALTANAVSGMKEMYMEAGFCDYLAKPVKPSDLEKCIIDNLPEEKVELIN